MRLSQQLPCIRGYLFQDGQLHMSLCADGGILSINPPGSDAAMFIGSSQGSEATAVLPAKGIYVGACI